MKCIQEQQERYDNDDLGCSAKCPQPCSYVFVNYSVNSYYVILNVFACVACRISLAKGALAALSPSGRNPPRLLPILLAAYSFLPSPCVRNTRAKFRQLRKLKYFLSVGHQNSSCIAYVSVNYIVTNQLVNNFM